MKKKRTVYLPEWQKWLVVPLVLGIWGWMTFDTFFAANPTENMGLPEYLLFSAVVIGTGVVTYLMADGKLPAYTIEEEITDDESGEE